MGPSERHCYKDDTPPDMAILLTLQSAHSHHKSVTSRGHSVRQVQLWRALTTFPECDHIS